MTERFTMSLDGELAEQFDAYIDSKGYTNRSEAIRDLIRKRLTSDSLASHQNGHCIASLSYIYNHHERELASRLMDIQHNHHDLVLASQHVHLDHDNCLETLMLRGQVRTIHDFTEAMIAERGVRHGSLNLIPVEFTDRHKHGSGTHTHSKPIV